MPLPQSKEWPLLIGLGIFLLNIALKLPFLTSQDIAGDEPFSIYAAQLPVADIIAFLSTGNNPPLWEVLLHHWMAVFGNGPWSVRMLPMAFSCMTAYIVYRIGLAVVGQRAGLMAALLYSLSNHGMALAHEARCYALLEMLSALSFYHFARLTRPAPPTHRDAAMAGMANLLILCTHYLGFFVLLSQTLATVLLPSARQGWQRYPWRWVWVFALPALGYLPYLPVATDRLTAYAAHGTWLSPPDGLGSLFGMLAHLSNKSLVALLCLPFLVATLYRALRNEADGARLAALWFFVPFGLMFAISFIKPMWMGKYLAFAAPGFYLSIALGMEALLRSKWAMRIGTAAVLVLFAATVRPNLSNSRQVRAAVGHAQSLREAHPEAAIIVCPDFFSLNLLYYWDRDCFGHQPSLEAIRHNRHACLIEDRVFVVQSITEADTAAIRASGRAIYLDAAARFTYGGNGIEEWLSDAIGVCQQEQFPKIFTVYHCHR